MERTITKEELVDNAERIKGILNYFAQCLTVLETANCYLQENQVKCRAIGLRDNEIGASQLEANLRDAIDYGRYINSQLEKSSAEYVTAIKNCEPIMHIGFFDQRMNI